MLKYKELGLLSETAQMLLIPICLNVFLSQDVCDP